MTSTVPAKQETSGSQSQREDSPHAASSAPNSAADADGQNLPIVNLGQDQVLALLKTLPQIYGRQQSDPKDAAETLSSMSQGGAGGASNYRHTSQSPTASYQHYSGEAGPSSPTLKSPRTDGGESSHHTDRVMSSGVPTAPERKDNHKEVERRRRGNINEGITELGRIVPNGSGEKAKGAILARAVQYIHHLKENEARNIEKWTLEKLLMDQAMGDLQAQLEEMKRMWEEERAARVRLQGELEVVKGMRAPGQMQDMRGQGQDERMRMQGHNDRTRDDGGSDDGRKRSMDDEMEVAQELDDRKRARVD